MRDEGDSLFLMQQRCYDAAAGRFLQRDPLGYDAGPNLLAFAAGNPLAYADPDGRIAIETVLVIGFGIYAIGKAASYGIEKINASIRQNQEAGATRDRFYEAVKSGDIREQDNNDYRARTAEGYQDTLNRTGQVIVNTGVETVKQLVPGGNTVGGIVAKELITDQVGDTLKDPILRSIGPDDTPQAEPADMVITDQE